MTNTDQVVLQISQPQLPTVPVSSILLGPAAPAGTSAAPPTTVSAAGPITDGGIDLVSQIKVPVSIATAAAAATAPSPMGGGGKKRRGGSGFSSACKYSSPHQGIKRSHNRGSFSSVIFDYLHSTEKLPHVYLFKSDPRY